MGIFVPIRAQKCRKNQKGQVAIFVALIFQVLFLFFAMVVNVGLLVHHKINLQNSVDLAAYYGAMKQAELLNVIAHSNYQIRQSWKLLAWRYRVLGTAGVMYKKGQEGSVAHPFNKVSKKVQPVDDDSAYDNGLAGFYDQPPFCVTYVPFKPMPPDESTCRYASNDDAVQLPVVPKTFWSVTAITGQARAITMQGINSALDRCKNFGSFNYGTLGRFIIAYAMDQAQRKLLISALANNMSNPDDFLDLDGNSVRQGAYQTFLNNLTDANRKWFESGNESKFNFFNSMASSKCGKRPEPNVHPKWLSEIRILPGFGYKDTQCTKTSNSGNIVTNSKPIDVPPKETAQSEALQDLVNNIKGIIPEFMSASFGNEFYPFHASVGFEKDPWCETYVGIKAEASPKIPFSLGEIEILSQAFAKPFGGSIGPWYKKTFPNLDGENAQSNGERVDESLPTRFADAANQSTAGYGDITRVANYGRFPGDKIGLRSTNILGYYSQAIYFLSASWNPNYSWPIIDDTPNFDHWIDIERDFKYRNESDILAWNENQDQPYKNRMRLLELSALSPDIFDLTYYSIEPNFYKMYGERLNKSIAAIASKAGIDYVGKYGNTVGVRGDLGSRINGGNFIPYSGSGGSRSMKYFNVIDQIEAAEAVQSNTLGGNKVLGFDYKFIARKFTHLLTWWTSKDFLDYSFDGIKDQKFGKCAPGSTLSIDDVPSPGNCLYGGRTGYSVKLVSRDFLWSSEQKPGGELSGVGRIKNPPPEDF